MGELATKYGFYGPGIIINLFNNFLNKKFLKF